MLPVMLRPTAIDTIPPYLKGVQILKSDGNLAVDLQTEVARVGVRKKAGLTPRRLGLVGLAAGAAVLVYVLASGIFGETSLACGYRDGPKSGMVEVAGCWKNGCTTAVRSGR